jgi:DNA polymerase-3 subunit epsilon
MNFVALDFETANAARTSACALGVAVVENGEITVQKSWLIKPTPFYFQFSWLHGITEEHTQNAPTFAEIWHELHDLLSYQTVIAHNAAFDMGVILAALKHYDLPVPHLNYLCTVQIARRTWKKLPYYNLKALSDKFEIPLQHHNALSDTLACAKIMLKAHETLQVNTIKDLCQTLSIKTKVMKNKE